MEQKELKTSPVFTGRSVDRILSILLYLFVAFCTIFIGVKFINHSIDSKFCINFLSEWEITCKKSISVGVKWPSYNPGQKKLYMKQYVESCQSAGIKLPESNTNYSYIYEINKIGAQKQPVFVLCLPSKIVIFGLSETTIERTDNFIDKKTNFTTGNFTAFPDKKKTFTGILTL